jgi:hypothetical protein
MLGRDHFPLNFLRLIINNLSSGGEKCTDALVGKPQEKRQLERPKRRWKENAKTGI